jgi:hypothetical protein
MRWDEEIRGITCFRFDLDLGLGLDYSMFIVWE